MIRVLLRSLGKLNHLPNRPMYLTPVFQGNSSTETFVDMPRNNYGSNNLNGMDDYNKLKKRLIWVDLEMSGLEPETCHILEMACIITDEDLNIIAEGPNLIINQPDEVLKSMNKWCRDHHGDSGLTEAVRASTTSLQQAEFEMLSFVRQHTTQGHCPIAGNTVHADKNFLAFHMEQFAKHLHYRIVDVSSIKELCRRWYPDVFANHPQKKSAHRAMDDIQESIKELKYYRENIFK